MFPKFPYLPTISLCSQFSTSHCDVTTSTGTYSCLRLKLTFYCTEGTKVKACFDENGALTFPRD